MHWVAASAAMSLADAVTAADGVSSHHVMTALEAVIQGRMLSASCL